MRDAGRHAVNGQRFSVFGSKPAQRPGLKRTLSAHWLVGNQRKLRWVLRPPWLTSPVPRWPDQQLTAALLSPVFCALRTRIPAFGTKIAESNTYWVLVAPNLNPPSGAVERRRWAVTRSFGKRS